MGSIPNAFALIPAYSHVDDRLLEALGRAGMRYHAFHRCSDLVKCRSQLLTLGLTETDADVFVLIDSDVCPTVEQLQALAASPLLDEWRAVTGAYVTRSGMGAFTPLDLDARVELGAPGYTECSGAGLGFAAVHRKCLERVAAALPKVADRWWPFCVPTVEQTEAGVEYFPDDYVFWRRLRATGSTLWLDQELLVAHVIGEPRTPVAGMVTRG